MPFPQDALGLESHVLIGGVWTRISPAPYTRDPITHRRGRAYRATAADPSEASVTIPNRDGKWTSRNPEGPYYGLLSRNTPLKVTIPGGPVTYLDMSGLPDRATTPHTAALNVVDLDIRWEGEASWYDAGAQMLIGKWGAAGNRSYHLRIEAGRLALHTTQDGTSGSLTVIGLPSTLPARAALRATLDADNGAGGYTTRFFWSTSLDGPWTQVGADSVNTGTLTIYASTAPLSIAPQQLDLATVLRQPVRGRTYRAQVRSVIDGTIVANPDFTAQPAGTSTFTDSVARAWSLAGDARITDRVTRCELEVPEWPTVWSASEADAWTSIAPAGILRRLSQGQKPLDSTLRRRIPSGAPIAYWPMEDGPNATQFYSPTASVRPLSTAGMQLAAESSLAGSSPLPTIQGGSTLSGTVPAPAGAAPTQWHTEFLFKTPGAGPTTARTLLQWLGTGTVRRWRLMLVSTGCELYGYDAADNVVTSSLLSLSTQIYGVWCRWRLWAVQNGANVTWNYHFVPIGGTGSGLVTTSYAGAVGRISGVRGPEGGYSSDLAGTALGHLGVFTTPNTGIYNSADIAFNGETAAARIQRLCSEEGVPLTIVGTPAGTQRVGPQRPAALLDLLRAAAEADGGIFGESQTRGLLYRTRASMYDQAPKLTLDYAARQIAPPLEPVEDDQVRNEWTVEREGASSAVASLATGPLSIADIGYYPDSRTLSLFSDEQTEQLAGWLLHLSTWSEARYPSVTIRLHRHPEMIPAVLGLDVGDKIRLVNLPKRFAGGGAVELLVDSWEETLLPRTWEITFNCSPAGPWTTGAVATVEDFEDTTFEIPYTTGGTLPWLRTNAQAHTGSWSLRSGAITHNQTSDAIVAIPPGMTEMRVWYWTSSEGAGPGFLGDRLLVLVDGVQILSAQGTTPWTQAIVDVTGKSQVIFRYVKDNSASSGSDFVAIDNLSFTGLSPTRVDTDGSQLAADVPATATSLSVAAGPLWITSSAFPAEFPFEARLGGEVVRVTGISGAASPQTWTVVRSVNGVVKSQTAGTDVRLAAPAIVAL
ncbi:hypothetical protein [Streptomyces acidiscabies]|uniref:hypothetical protein n=1 Tax=Streptomyces acidiscabies TaxID=42234 RepID=UPI00073F1D9D|nr:hypothetical protein [Streptomyces acidiscabies]GAQ52057.1 hypothetical protein a10_01838 [Streptomyces acidiscabies]